MQLKIRILALVLISAIGLSCSSLKKDLITTSPNGELKLELKLVENQLKYAVNWLGEEIVSFSMLNVLKDKPLSIVEIEELTVDETWKTVWGQFSKIQNNYNELQIGFEAEEITGVLVARVYNDGVAFRFKLPAGKKQGTANLYCEFNLPKESSFYAPNGEKEPLGPVMLSELANIVNNTAKPKQQKKGMRAPLVAETPSGKYIAMLESDLFSATGFLEMHLGIDSNKENVFTQSEVELGNDELVTPWRVILFGETAGDLVVNTTPVNLAAPCKIKNTDWIKPGLTLWDWRVHGYTAKDGFTYGIDTESYMRFIDFAAEYNIDYFLIDDAWYRKVSKGHFELSDKLDLQAVIEYADAKKVNLLLYYDRHRGEYGDKDLYPYYQSLNMKGIKYGFMGRNTPFSRDAIEQSSKSELLINFHDGPVPMTGVRRTFPNAITREYCHAQQDSRRAFTPESFLKMAFINALTGPLDMNNGNFDITGINAGERQKGPRKLSSYPSTVVSEAARTLVIFSGLVCIPDAPEAYKAKSDLFEFIQKQPVGKWDESKILNSKIGEYITTARRAGKEWFIGSVISQKGGELEIGLDFLEDGVEYDVTHYEDNNETHCTSNPEAYQIRKGMVKKGDVVKAKMAPGGGHCMWIRPAGQ